MRLAHLVRVLVFHHMQIALIAALLFAARAAYADPCTVVGTHAAFETVHVKTDDGHELDVHVGDMAAAAQVPSRRGAEARVAFRGVVAFYGRVPNIWYTVARDITVASGMVQLKRGAQIVDVYQDARGVHGKAIVWPGGDVLPGEDKHPDEVIGEITLPCDALALGVLEDTEEAAEDAAAGDDVERTWWFARGSEALGLQMYAQPRVSAQSVVYRAPNCSGAFSGIQCLEIEEMERRGGWRKVRRMESDIVVEGWVPVAALAPVPDGLGVGGRTAGCSGDHKFSSFGLMGTFDRSRIYEGPARITVGTRIGAWATVREPTGFEIEQTREGGSGNVLTYVMGIAGVEIDDWYGGIPNSTVTPTPPAK